MVESRTAWATFTSAFEPELIDRVFSSAIDGTWSTHRDHILELSNRQATDGKRRLSFLAQIGAETAGYVGDVESCVVLLQRAVELDSFDRHWFDRCPTLAGARETSEGERLLHIVTRRAEAILDALYGDRASPSDTVVD